MNESLKTILWQQFGAAIDMLENAVAVCPETLWNTPSKFWYTAYHTLFFLDYYLSDETQMEKDFLPPAPYTTSEFDDGAMPERVYNRDELLSYCKFGRQKSHDLLGRLSEEELFNKRFISEYKNYSLFEMMLYNMRLCNTMQRSSIYYCDRA